MVLIDSYLDKKVQAEARKWLPKERGYSLSSGGKEREGKEWASRETSRVTGNAHFLDSDNSYLAFIL